MFINFGFGDVQQAILETYLGTQLIQRQQLEAPVEILKMQFMGLMQQLINEDKPMSCKLIVPDIIWDEYEKKQKVLENYVEFKNRLMEE